MVSEAEVREIVLVVVVGPSLPKLAGVNEAKTVELLTILRPVRISTEDHAGITEITTTAHQREVQPRTWVETSRANSAT